MPTAFSIFRKHQRVMMAAVGILCMVAFTLGGLTSFERFSFSDARNPVVASTAYGDFHETDLQELELQRSIAKDFLRRVLYASVDPRMMSPQMERSVEGMLEQLLGPSTERSVIETRILAEEAREAGLVVSDDAITDFLRTLTQDQVTAQRFQDELSRMRIRGQQRVSKSMVFDALRMELLARNFQVMFMNSLQVTPAQRWDYYQRLKRQVRVELVAVNVADFEAQVADPGDVRLTAFFNEYNDVEPKPGSPDPGFKVPARAAFDYFEAHYDQFFDPAAVSEADVKAHYEKNKDIRYRYSASSEQDLEELEEKQPAGSAEKPAASGKDEPKQGDQGGAEDAEKPAAATGEMPPAAPATKPAGDAAPPNSKDTKPAVKPQSMNESGRGADAIEESLLALADDAKAAIDKAAPADENKSAPAEKPVAEKPTAEKPTAEKPVGEKPVAEKPADAGKSPPSPPPALTEKYALPRDVRGGAKPKYESLWKVEPEIRRELAGDRAAAKTRNAVLTLQGKMRKYSEVMLNWEQKHKAAPDTPKPPAPNFEELAKSIAGVTFHRLPLASAFQIAHTPGIGQSTLAGQRFVEFAMLTLRPFHLAVSQDTDGNDYLFWKTDDQPTRVPKFAEARSEVLRAWKVREGRKLMLKRAEALAAEARKAKKSLQQTFADQKQLKVSETGPFSWMTVGAAGAFTRNVSPKLSEVPGVVDPGSEFMREVFELRVGDVGVAVNQPETSAYVVRVTSSEPPLPVLRDTFLADKMNFGYMAIAREENGFLMRAWTDERNRIARLVWIRPPADERMSLDD